MRCVRLLILVMVLCLPLAHVRLVQAQEATPAAVSWVDRDLDLAAMPVTPDQMADLGFPGFGRFHNGYYFPASTMIDAGTGFYGQSLEATHAALDPMGISRGFGSSMGEPATPGDENAPMLRGSYMNIIQYSNPAAADAFLEFITNSPGNPGTQFTVTRAPFSLGDGAVIINFANPDAESGQTYHEFDVVFRTGDLYVDTGLWTQLPTDTASPVASPVAGDAGLTSPAGTVAELERIGRQALANVEAVRENGSPNLPSLLLRLGDDPLEATDDYTEGYRLLNGAVLPYYADRQDDIIADPAMLAGATAAYELEELFRRGEESAPGDPYFLTRLFAFPDAATAEAFMASRPEALADGGFSRVSTAAPETKEELLAEQLTDIGDESLAFGFVRAFTDGTVNSGHEVYVRVGNHVAALSLEGPPGMPLSVVAEIAEAQAACLEAGACPEAIPVPAEILAAEAGTPIAATPEAST